MVGNDQKRVWEYNLSVGPVIFCDLEYPGRYYDVLEGDFDVDSQNPRVGYGCEKFKNIIFFQTSQNFMK